MGRSFVVRLLSCVSIAAFLVLAPPRLRHAIGQEEWLSLFRIRDRVTLETITLYHIASARTYQGSVTVFLQDSAKAFEAKHRGVYIQVEGMTPESHAERLENGRVPDAYSFFCGDLYREQLQPMPTFAHALLPGLRQNGYCLPYLFSGYVLCKTEQSPKTPADLLQEGKLASDALHPARLGLQGELMDISAFKEGKCSAAVLDMRTAGDMLRSERYGSLTCEPLDAFTDQVCCLGIARDTDAEKAAWLRAFFDFLLSEEQQAKLTVLGAFPVLEAVEPVYAQSLVSAAYATHRSGVSTPDPFAWQAHRVALGEDARLAVSGDVHARDRFFERWAVVFDG